MGTGGVGTVRNEMLNSYRKVGIVTRVIINLQ